MKLINEVDIRFNAADLLGHLAGGDEGWTLECMDTMTGKVEEVKLDSEQAGAVMYLFVTGGGELEKEMYAKLEGVFDGWAENARPIP